MNHYHELLLLPVLWALLRTARRPQVFTQGLITGAVLVAITMWLTSCASSNGCRCCVRCSPSWTIR
jgi:hypothetical protein